MSQEADSCLWKGIQRATTENYFKDACSFGRSIREHVSLVSLNLGYVPKCKVSKFQPNGGNSPEKLGSHHSSTVCEPSRAQQQH